jgi:hypothetical protein
VQKDAKRTRVVLPIPSVVTRWDSSSREVSSLNRIMGDFNSALNILMDDSDNHLLSEADVERSDFVFTQQDRLILRQFECGSEPCLKLSKFFQLNASTVHETLFVVRARVAQMCEKSFVMFADISHTPLPDLTKRTKSVFVVSADDNTPRPEGREEQEMEECIETYRRLFSEDMEKRCGLVDQQGDPVYELPATISMAALLNPLYGGMLYIVLLPFSLLIELTQFANPFF